MSVKVSTWAWEMPVKGNEKLVLLALADYANDEGKCWPHIEKIAEKCGISRSAVIDHLKNLHDLKVFTKETLYDNFGKKKGNVYQLNLSLSPASLRTDLLSSNLLSSKNTATKSRFTPSLSPDSGPLILEPSLNHHEPSKNMSPPAVVTQNLTQSCFEQFWKIYPRKKKKKYAQKIWKTKKLDTAVDEKTGERVFSKIMADVPRRTAEDAEWLAGCISHPSSYLNGELWNDEIISANQSQAPPGALRGNDLEAFNAREREKFFKMVEETECKQVR